MEISRVPWESTKRRLTAAKKVVTKLTHLLNMALMPIRSSTAVVTNAIT